MTPEEAYLFDLNGYLIVRGVLDDTEVAVLNGLIDEHELPEPGESFLEQRFGGFLLWSDAFRDLLDHPRLLPLLKEIVDPGLRLDRYYGIHMRPGTSGLPLHGGAYEIDDMSEYFLVRHGRMYNGITTVSWALTDLGAASGGFACIPGSHKSDYQRPEEWDHTSDAVKILELRAGDAVVFTGAISHGTYPWSGSTYRRSLLFKYAPGYLAWSSSYLDWSPDLLAELTPQQSALFWPPYAYRRDEVGGGDVAYVAYEDPTAKYTA